MKYFFSVILVFIAYNYSFGQTKCNYLKFVILVDNNVPTPSYIRDVEIIYENGQVKDTINLAYDVGSLSLNDNNNDKFIALDSKKKVLFQFRYMEKGTNKKYHFKYLTDAKLLNYGYMIFKVYNYENKKNWKEFGRKKGYGIEYQASDRSSVLSRRSQ